MKKLAVFLAMVLIVAACSDDKKNPVNNDPQSTTKNYLPMKSGSFWIYDTYDLDMQNQVNPETKQIDSVVAGEKSIYLEKEATKLKQFVDGELNANYHFYTEEKSIFAESNYILPLNSGFGLPIDKITNQWVKIADFDGTNWDVLSYQFADESISMPQLPSGIKLNADYKVTAARSAGNVAIPYGDTNLDAVEITLSHTVTGSISYLLFSFPITFTITQKLYFAKDIGIVKVITQSQKININLGVAGSQTIDVPGHQKTLTNYKLQ